MNRLNWRKNMTEAASEISGGTRLLLMFFHRAEDESCIKTLTETLEDENVVRVIEREAVPLKFEVEENKEMAGRYHIDWVPTFIVAEENGRELERWVGYLPPREFTEQLLLSKGIAAFHLERLAEAIREFEELVEEFPDSELVPEAEYYLGAASYKQTGSTDAFDDACEMLTRTHPESIWTKKCAVWAHPPRFKKPFVGY
ncbi:MAG: thioredoxin fold domain-containing protein, partial [Deltaproteobacteria bacterium]|nr:thioredoxin fold domain-containing protein [Deltaproteobacteria bacterium]